MEGGYTIRAVSQLTGITEHVIRAWEKRYGVVHPTRTAGNHRTYSETDLVRLRLLSQAVAAGRTIGEVATLPNTTLEDFIRQASRSFDSSASAEEFVARGFLAVKGLNGKDLRETLETAQASLGELRTIADVVSPLMDEIGRGWFEGHLSIMHEHFASGLLRTYLGTVFQKLETANAVTGVVVAAPAGQDHEFGALSCSIIAAEIGMRVTHLGANVPADDILRAVADSESSAVVLSVVFPQSMPRVRAAVLYLEESLPKDIRLIIGGASAIQLGSRYQLRTLDDLRRELSVVDRERTSVVK